MVETVSARHALRRSFVKRLSDTRTTKHSTATRRQVPRPVYSNKTSDNLFYKYPSFFPIENFQWKRKHCISIDQAEVLVGHAHFFLWWIKVISIFCHHVGVYINDKYWFFSVTWIDSLHKADNFIWLSNYIILMLSGLGYAFLLWKSITLVALCIAFVILYQTIDFCTYKICQNLEKWNIRRCVKLNVS